MILAIIHQKKLFEFDIDYSKFTDRLNETRNKWTLYTNGKKNLYI